MDKQEYSLTFIPDGKQTVIINFSVTKEQARSLAVHNAASIVGSFKGQTFTEQEVNELDSILDIYYSDIDIKVIDGN